VSRRDGLCGTAASVPNPYKTEPIILHLHHFLYFQMTKIPTFAIISIFTKKESAKEQKL
jgi:hypothetical protein